MLLLSKATYILNTVGNPHRSNLGWSVSGTQRHPPDPNTNAQPTAPHAANQSWLENSKLAGMIARLNTSLATSLRFIDWRKQIGHANKIKYELNCYTFTAALAVRDRSLVLVTRLFKATSLGVTVCVLTVYLSFKLQSILESTHLAPVLTARSICSEEWATSMNWKSIRQPDIDIYRWSSGAQEGGGVMGVTLHPGPFSIHQERCMDRLNVRTRSESWRVKVTETDKERV